MVMTAIRGFTKHLHWVTKISIQQPASVTDRYAETSPMAVRGPISASQRQLGSDTDRSTGPTGLATLSDDANERPFTAWHTAGTWSATKTFPAQPAQRSVVRQPLLWSARSVVCARWHNPSRTVARALSMHSC